MNTSSLRVAKDQLRLSMKTRLKLLSNDAIASQSSQVFDALLTFRPYINAKSVAIYLSMPGGELQTDSIVRHALSSGKQVFIPYLHKSGLQPSDGPARLMDMVSLKGIADYESLQRDKWGIPSVDAATVSQRKRSVGELGGDKSEDAALDLILMPGVAFDRDPISGTVRRLGHGKGFYDYFLHRYAMAAAEADKASNGRPTVLLYALGLREQFLSPTSGESVPVGPHDQPIDGVLLGDGEIIESSTETT
ncbi:uncharacterized protein BCR38DRAFT_344788 [Pseudomassariella vexata]|uniref:5-formyltetrahydrofolate cyclo-ligase n=1 Tax=Pseudomassariella vexata TaxID=1141098 RepID=A0A1Y2DUV3_9PEZI|nr:uncharacterized protein BCR38DRAFT_344788 [Pseudomassariella vexata]ORY62924.1 hypothetical protein BCR38DRAFT_344788 [Pseudomassariella vexata]